MPDQKPEKSGIVRDLRLRFELRSALARNKIDPDDFTEKQLNKSLASSGPLTSASGMPIKSAILLRTINDPVIIPLRRFNYQTRRFEVDTRPSAQRVYLGGNNHHVEIFEDLKTGKWFGQIVTAYAAAQRLSKQLSEVKKQAQAIAALGLPVSEHKEKVRQATSRIHSEFPIVDRRDKPNARFIMSLAEGETILLKSPPMKVTQTAPVDAFVVVKLDKKVKKNTTTVTIVFAHHSDARPATGKHPETGEKLKAPHPLLREVIELSPAQLKENGATPNQPPVKVRVDSLGHCIELKRD